MLLCCYSFHRYHSWSFDLAFRVPFDQQLVCVRLRYKSGTTACHHHLVWSLHFIQNKQWTIHFQIRPSLLNLREGKAGGEGLRAATSPVTWSVSRVGLSRVLYSRGRKMWASWGIATFRRNCVVSSRRPTGVALWRQRISCGLVSTAIKSEMNQREILKPSMTPFSTWFMCSCNVRVTITLSIGLANEERK